MKNKKDRLPHRNAIGTSSAYFDSNHDGGIRSKSQVSQPDTRGLASDCQIPLEKRP
jgi:hypothetical protein